jgi:succinate dehydrogenase / fumarate reductase membrane anchor subunit
MDLPTLLRWMFFQNPNHVVNSNITDISQGWVNAFWQTMEILTVFLAISHGFNGLRVVIEDYFGPSSYRPLMRGTLLIVWLSSIIISVFVILAS